MFSSARGVGVRFAEHHLDSRLQYHLERFTASDQRHRIIKVFKWEFGCDKPALQEHLSKSGRQYAAHGFPCFEEAAADHTANGQAFEDDVASEVQLHFAVGNAEQH